MVRFAVQSLMRKAIHVIVARVAEPNLRAGPQRVLGPRRQARAVDIGALGRPLVADVAGAAHRNTQSRVRARDAGRERRLPLTWLR